MGLNYCLPRVYAGGGYQFGYLLYGNLPVNEFDHAMYFQVGYKIGFADVVLKYSGTLNKEPGGVLADQGIYSGDNNTQSKVTYTPKANTFELSLIFNLGAKK